MATHSDVAAPSCPSWCVERHGLVRGEDDWVHTGMVTTVRQGLVTKLCMTVDPRTGHVDGPYVLLNGDEVSLPDARALGLALLELTETGDQTPMPPATAGVLGRQRTTAPADVPASVSRMSRRLPH